MATTERNPKSNSYPSNSSISTLRTNIAAGNVIYASDINSLKDLINGWLGHTHTYDDAYQLATFGNNGDRTDYYEDKTTATIGQSNVGAVSNTTTITASYHNTLKDRTNSVRSHLHSIDDRTAI